MVLKLYSAPVDDGTYADHSEATWVRSICMINGFPFESETLCRARRISSTKGIQSVLLCSLIPEDFRSFMMFNAVIK